MHHKYIKIYIGKSSEDGAIINNIVQRSYKCNSLASKSNHSNLM